MLGAILGLIVGAMPGLGSLAGVALLLPLTYKFEPTTAIIMLGALYYSNMYGGAFSAILLNIPGDSPGHHHRTGRLSHGQEGPSRPGADGGQHRLLHRRHHRHHHSDHHRLRPCQAGPATSAMRR